MLEGILPLGEQPRLVEELGSLELRQATVQRVLREIGDGLQQGQRDFMAHDGRSLEQVLLLRRQPVDASRQHRLHCGRHLYRRQRLRHVVGPRLADEHAGLHQRAHAFLQEEGVALSACDQQVHERCQAQVLPEERLQELVGTHRGQRIESHLCVVGLRTPPVLILWTIVDQEQQVGRGQALDQTVEEGLRLGIDPVQVFADQQQRLPLTFAQQHALEGLERALAALWRVEV
jgi:hypothetical protein